MATQHYLDFDLQITTAPDGYQARVLYSPAGQASVPFKMPFSDGELVSLVQQLLQSANMQSGLFAQGMLKEAGRRLFEAIFYEKTLLCLGRSLDEAQRQGAGLRLRLRLTEVPELMSIPWEYLYHPGLNRFLVLSMKTPLVYYLDLMETLQPLTVSPPLNLLVMIAHPAGVAALDAEQEWATLQAGLSGLIQQGLIAVDRVEPPTLTALQHRLRQKEYHIFHFIGHGLYDEHTQKGMLLFADEAGEACPVEAEKLSRILHDESTLRLAILNACEGSRTSLTDPYAGTAQALVQQGMPAVVAMQFSISDRAAITFSREFYAALADGEPVDAALSEARKAIANEHEGGEWGTPVLLMRAPDGVLWQRATAAPSTESPPPQGNAQSVGQGLGALIQLMQSPEMRAAVVAFRTDFQAACEQIDVLGNYKALHDLLHTLEYLCYNGIVQESRRFPDDEMALSILMDHELTFQGILAQLAEVMARAGMPATEGAWVQDLIEAQGKLNAALEAMDGEALKTAIRLLKRVLDRHPTRINARLNAAARALRLVAIEGALTSVWQKSQPYKEFVGQGVQIGQGLRALAGLNQELTLLVEAHDQWQAIDLELRRIEATMGHDLAELEWSWSELRAMAEPLYKDVTEAWALALLKESENLLKALGEQSPVKTRLYFQRYRRLVGNHFFQVDTDLKMLCDELRQVGEPLAAVLQVI